MNKVDEDQSGQIEFPEFLKIIKGSEVDESSSKISTFFKDLCNGKFGIKEISFPVFVNQMKRQSLIDAIKSNDPKLKFEGNKILVNLKEHMKIIEA